MKLRELLLGVETAELHADAELEIADIAYNSREVKPGFAFAAVRGYVTDGHRYIGAAVKNGAAVIICEAPPGEPVPYVLVENSRLALALMSANFFGHPADKLRIVGVTGTNGKTTVTHLVKTMLESLSGEKAGLIGTNHNIIGDKVYDTERTTPESYDLHRLFAEMVRAGCRFAVMEVSSHSLVVGRVEGVRFEVGAFTNLTQDHLDFHHTMEEYRDAKGRLFSQSDGAVLNIDDPCGQYFCETVRCPVTTIAEKRNEADIVAKDVKLKPDRVEFCAVETGKIERMELRIPGDFSVYNALTAIACCQRMGFGLDSIAAALKKCEGVRGRAEVVYHGDFTVIIDFAHGPDALSNILKTVRGFAGGRIVLLFGAGGERDVTKRPKMGRIAAELADYVIISSDNPRHEDPERIIDDVLAGMKGYRTPVKRITERRAAVLWALSHARPGDTLILAGKGHETYQVIGDEKQHLDEHEIVREFIAAKKK